jgi:cytochrome c biogenesis protein CcmG/thiol:disulfide interchange protein DsbE
MNLSITAGCAETIRPANMCQKSGGVNFISVMTRRLLTGIRIGSIFWCMRTLTLILINLAVIAWPACADERFAEIKAGGITYSNVVVVRVTATDILFVSANGIGSAKLASLDPALQQHFAGSAAAAAESEKNQAASSAQYLRAVTPQMSVTPPTQQKSELASPMPATDKKLWARSFLNQKAPDLIVEKWLTAEPDTHGKFVLIDFWATWCGPCRRAIPELNALHQKFGDKLAVIGISDESEAAVRKMTEPKIEYAVAIDTQARMKQAVEVKGIPHVMLMDPSGIVRWEGFPLLSGYELTEQVVADILAKYSAAQ